MKYAEAATIALLSIFLTSCQEQVVEYVPPIELSANPSSISLKGEIGDKDDDGNEDLSCNIDNGAWNIRVSGGTQKSSVIIEGMTQKWFYDISDESPSNTDNVDPIERLDVEDRVLSKSDFPTTSLGWWFSWGGNFDGFRLVRELKYRSEAGGENVVSMELICEP
jgi:hypothetical protein